MLPGGGESLGLPRGLLHKDKFQRPSVLFGTYVESMVFITPLGWVRTSLQKSCRERFNALLPKIFINSSCCRKIAHGDHRAESAKMKTRQYSGSYPYRKLTIPGYEVKRW